MPPKNILCFHALRELLVQSEANNYSTNYFKLWPDMLYEAKVYSWASKTGLSSAFLVVLHLPAALELRRANWV